MSTGYGTEAEKLSALWVVVTTAVEQLNILSSEFPRLRSQLDRLSSEVCSLRSRVESFEEDLVESLSDLHQRLDLLHSHSAAYDLGDLGPQTTDISLANGILAMAVCFAQLLWLQADPEEQQHGDEKDDEGEGEAEEAATDQQPPKRKSNPHNGPVYSVYMAFLEPLVLSFVPL
ncbi:unnamed protein product [Symbiodinium necroappetens]|uniref:Uncharacterized protein n=1 Tax=Symbiodinium necroappetens TaxID=1628268 RepID=A0A812X141_9DINO|nr:unnamed protein product [Symbiodinium necroappetens]